MHYSRLSVAVLASVFALGGAGFAAPAPEREAVLARGINFTNWFRFPARSDDEFLRSYIDDATMERLHSAGFTFVRLAVQPRTILNERDQFQPARADVLIEVIRRIERHGLGVVIGWHAADWNLETSQDQRQLLETLWDQTAARMRGLDMRLTFPEIINEPVFPDEPAWEALQRSVLTRIRARLPDATVVLTGNNWGSLDGLLALHPVEDANVAYSFHDYEPQILTTQAAFDPSLDQKALTHLPFPSDTPACPTTVEATSHAHTADVIRWYCGQGWNVGKVRERLHQAGAWARRNGAYVFAGEIGASRDMRPEARYGYLTAVRTALEAERLGWALWGYDDSMGFDLHPGYSSTLDPRLLKALGLQGTE
jgi:hypothetical protein